ncbi:TPA: 50S ribosomal protein L22 [Candidatus Sumerlaeota bacterium]|nr:50S ribosomal protein L22 [Candidatus Sumerlaeota bacterium]
MAFQQDNEIASTCKAKFQRVSARKARLLADLVRGKAVPEAMNLLTFTHRPSAQTIMLNVLKSAIANAKSDYPDPAALAIGEVKVDDGPIMYRMQPMSRGRAGRIRKRFCHITMHLVAVK